MATMQTMIITQDSLGDRYLSLESHSTEVREKIECTGSHKQRYLRNSWIQGLMLVQLFFFLSLFDLSFSLFPFLYLFLDFSAITCLSPHGSEED